MTGVTGLHFRTLTRMRVATVSLFLWRSHLLVLNTRSIGLLITTTTSSCSQGAMDRPLYDYNNLSLFDLLPIEHLFHELYLRNRIPDPRGDRK